MSTPEPVATARVISADVRIHHRLGEIWRYRELLVGLVRKELKVRYKNSALGFLWSMLNPATSLLVYYVVFQLILRNGVPHFAIYLISGVLVWNLFSAGLLGATGSIVGNSQLVKKVAFPREILALASVGAALVHFFLQSVVLLAFLVGFHYGPALAYVPLIVPALITLLVFTSGLGVLLAALNVPMRDVQHLVEIGLNVWFWATPIVYLYHLISSRHPGLVTVYRLANPVTPVVLAFQRAIYARPAPMTPNGRLPILPLHASPWWYLGQLAIEFAVGMALLLFAMRVFARLEGNFAEEL